MAAFRCPTKADVLNACLALLPRGRAWQTHEGGPLEGIQPTFNRYRFDNAAFATDFRKASVLRQYWQAVSEIFWFATKRLCDLRLEFWCATHSETHDQWMTEYGLPDACDPFPDLCAKVAAIGGTRCEYYQEIAARAGWALQCLDGVNTCGARPRAEGARAGRARPGQARNQGFIRVLVDLNASTSFHGPTTERTVTQKAGCSRAGRRLTCASPPEVIDLSPLECLLARVVHAEIQIVYEAFHD